jgi:hypothetical protein
MLDSNSDAVQPPRRTLVPGKLNVVGEIRTESALHRDAEKRFALEKTRSANYWTEADFPDLHQKVGIRNVRADRGRPMAAWLPT